MSSLHAAVLGEAVRAIAEGAAVDSLYEAAVCKRCGRIGHKATPPDDTGKLLIYFSLPKHDSCTSQMFGKSLAPHAKPKVVQLSTDTHHH